jgi:hypothetical protein
MATLSGNKIKNTYQALVKFSDNGNITTSAKQLTDGFGNNSPMWVSTTQVGIGVTPEAGLNLHVYGDAKIGSNLTVIGNLVVEGSTTTVGTDTLTVKDPLIVLANNNTSTDAVDIGFYGKYTPSGTTLYSGLFREALTGKYRLFKGLQIEPTTTVSISGTGYDKADLVIGNIETNGVVEDSSLFTFSKDILINKAGTTKLTIDNVTQNKSIELECTSLNNVLNAEGDMIFSSGSPIFKYTSSSFEVLNVDSTFGGDITVSTGTEGGAIFLGSSGSIFSEEGITFKDSDTTIQNVVAGGDIVFKTKTGAGSENTHLTLFENNTSTFGGQVTIPLTPSANTDAASKGYVDTQVGANNELSEVLANGNITDGTDIVVSAGDDITFTDTSKILLGDDDDLQIYHNGTNAVIDNGTNNLLIQTASQTIISSDATDNQLTLSHSTGNWFAKATNSNTLIIGSESNATDNITLDTTNGGSATFAGNLGIGISPSKKLTVFGTGAGNATVQIEGEGGADPYINFLANNAQHWSLGIDDSDSDKFKLSEHSALGTNDYFVVDTSGNTTFTGDVTSSGNIGSTIDANTTNQLSVTNSNSGSSATARVLIISDSGNMQLKAVSSTNTTYGAGDVGVINCDTMSGGLRFAHNDQVKYTLAFDGENTWTGGGTFGGNVTTAQINLNSSGGGIIDNQTGNIFIQTPSGTGWIFRNGASGYDEKMRIDSDGNVGINDTNPNTANLSIKGQSTGVSANYPMLKLLGQNTSSDGLHITTTGTGNNFYAIKVATGADSNAFNVTNAGNVGIGGSPSEQFEVFNDTASAVIMAKSSASTGDAYLILNASGTGAGRQSKIFFGDSADLDVGAIDYLHDSDSMQIRTAATTAIAIDSDQNVGIGTDSPTSYYSGADNLVVYQASGEAGITIATATDTTGALYFADGTTGDAEYRGGIAYTHSTDTLSLVSGGASRVTIDSDGNVGVGSGTPLYLLGAQDIGQIAVNRVPSTGVITDTSRSAAYINLNASNGGSSLTFHTANANNTAPTERMRIDSSGNVAIGFTGTNNYKFYINDGVNRGTSDAQIRINGNGYSGFHYLDGTGYHIQQNSNYRSLILISGTSGGVKLTAGATSWVSNSDESLKENIKPLEDILDKIQDYRCIEYNLIDDETKDKKIGFIAQDWEDDFPAIVDKDNDGLLGMKYTETIPVLLKAIQELKAEIDDLKNKCNCK